MADFTGTSGDDIITGTDDSDFIDVSQGGNDTVNAEGGDDVIYIGATLHKGDHIDGGSGYDTLQLDGDYGNLKLNQNLIANIEDIALGVGHDYHMTLAKTVATGGATLTIDGSALGASDALYVDGSKVKDAILVLNGGAGNDAIDFGYYAKGHNGQNLGSVDAGSGNDEVSIWYSTVTAGELQGGTGTDTLRYVAIALDVSEFSSASCGFEILAPVNPASIISGDDNANDFDFSGFTVIGEGFVAAAGGGGDDVLIGSSGNDLFYGQDGNDILSGMSGNDKLIGGDGDDALQGGTGKDVLQGGAGADTFIYSAIEDSTSNPANRDVITDFHHADGDLVDLSTIDADSTQDGNQAFHLGSSAFTDTPGELIQFVDAKGHTIVEGDVNGDGIADFAIEFKHAPVLVDADFVM